MVLRSSFTLAGLAMLMLAAVANAHHSGGMYDDKKEATVEGIVIAFEWTNPHVVLRVLESSQAGQPPKTWVIGLTSPGNLTRMGWSKRTFNPGDRVRVVIAPLRNGDSGGFFSRAVFLDTGREVRAPYSAAAVNSAPNLK